MCKYAIRWAFITETSVYESVCIINLKMYHWRFLRFLFLGAQYWSGGHGLYNLESTLNEKMLTLLFHKLKHCNYWNDFFNCPMLLYFFVGSSEDPRISHSFNTLWWYLHYCNNSHENQIVQSPKSWFWENWTQSLRPYIF